MISDISISSRNVAVGETLKFWVEGEGPILVQIRCFVDKPHPPGFRECRECKTKKVQSGDIVSFTADPETWKSWVGKYEITATDSTGDSKKVLIRVLQGEDRSQAVAPAGA